MGGCRRFCSGLSEPSFEARLAEPGVYARDKGALADFRAGVARVRVSDDFAGIVEGGQAPADEFIQTKQFRAAIFVLPVYAERAGNREKRDK